MNLFLIYFVIISLGMGLWLSKNGWAKMLALVPFGALVPAFFATASGCGAEFALHLFEAGTCQISDAPPFRLFSAYFVFGIVAVLLASLLGKLIRRMWGPFKAGE